LELERGKIMKALDLLKRENEMRKLFKSAPLSLDRPEELLDWVEGCLSPENLTCDGEASMAQVRMMSRALNQLKVMCHEKMGKSNIPNVGDIVSLHGRDFEILKINKVNVRAKEVSTGNLYNIRKTAFVS
jgi:hypothetical protein